MLLNVQKSAIFCRTGNESQRNNYECSTMQSTKTLNRSISKSLKYELRVTSAQNLKVSTLAFAVVILKSGRSSLTSFDHQKKPNRSFFALTFEVQKYSTKRRGLLMFSEIGKLHARKVISFTPAGECESAKS